MNARIRIPVLIAGICMLGLGACAPSQNAPVIKASEQPVVVAGCQFSVIETSPGGSSAPGTTTLVAHDEKCKAQVVNTAIGSNSDQALMNAVGLGTIGVGIGAAGALAKPAKGSTMTTNNCGAGANATVTC